MDAGGAYNPRTVEEVFKDFKGRRAGMIKALTTGKNWVFFSSFFFFHFLCFLTGKLNFVITLLRRCSGVFPTLWSRWVLFLWDSFVGFDFCRWKFGFLFNFLRSALFQSECCFCEAFRVHSFSSLFVNEIVPLLDLFELRYRVKSFDFCLTWFDFEFLFDFNYKNCLWSLWWVLFLWDWISPAKVWFFYILFEFCFVVVCFNLSVVVSVKH